MNKGSIRIMNSQVNDRQNAQEVLGDLMHKLKEASSKGEPSAYLEPMHGTSEQVEGLRSEAQFGSVKSIIDEPISFGGTGLAPNPAETMMASVAASLEVTINCYASMRGIKIRNLSTKMKGCLDNRAFFGILGASRAGFPIVDFEIAIDCDATDEQLAELIDVAQKCCPVLDNLRNPTEVSLTTTRI